MPGPRSFYFDITTTSLWRGHSVGIIRVEQELARRARKFLGPDANYCFYEKPVGAFRGVRDEYAARILADTARLPMVRSPIFGWLPPDLERRIRDVLLLRFPRLYRFIQKRRGMPDKDIPGIQSEVKRQHGVAEVETVSTDVALGPAIALDPSVTIMSGGLDWTDKDIGTISRLRAKTGFSYISIVHDLVPVNLPHYIVTGYAELLGAFMATLVRTADGCICNSKSTLRDLVAFCEKNGVPAPPASTFPLGFNFPAAGTVPEALPGDLAGKNLVLLVSTLEPRKNHRTAYQAWYHGVLSGTLDPTTDRLVFVGRPGWALDDLFTEIELNPVTGKSVVVLRDVSDAALQSLYRAAAFVILPSFHEGYGLPLAEAFGYGKVCVTSGAGALSEIGTGFRIDVDPRDTIGWATTMSELLRDPAKRARIEATIRQNYRPTSWDTSAEIFFAAVRDMTARRQAH